MRQETQQRRQPSTSEHEHAAAQGPFARNRRLLAAALLILLPSAVVLAVSVGAVRIPPREVVAAVVRGLSGLVGATPVGLPEPPVQDAIILQLRLPRVLLAALCGAALSLAGVAFQAVFRNPLADPYMLGASSGAALGAAAAVLAGLTFGTLGGAAVPACAFVGALTAVALAYGLARRASGTSTLGLLLAGVVVGSWAASALSLLIYFSGRFLAQIVFWLMGGFGAATWRSIGAALPYMTVGGAVVFGRARDLNLLVMGDETAMGLGVDAERSRRWLVAGASLLTAAAVAVSGPIGFVGLLVPHLVRFLVGADHWHLLPAAAGAGALLMVLADTVARTVLAPTELPVGIVTALCGGPFFLWLLTRRARFRSFGGFGGAGGAGGGGDAGGMGDD
ncbi:MAG: iron ABC transporter permease [Bacillota bacterium]|nr:iron ABC transporter permease [Bacillota bacterium]